MHLESSVQYQELVGSRDLFQSFLQDGILELDDLTTIEADHMIMRLRSRSDLVVCMPLSHDHFSQHPRPNQQRQCAVDRRLRYMHVPLTHLNQQILRLKMRLVCQNSFKDGETLWGDFEILVT